MDWETLRLLCLWLGGFLLGFSVRGMLRHEGVDRRD
jgi:hypothetical protein